MLLRILCAVFLLSVPFASCASNSTNATIAIKTGTKTVLRANLTTDVAANVATNTTTHRPSIDVANITSPIVAGVAAVNLTGNVTTTQAPTTVPPPPLSNLEKYLKIQRSFVLVRDADEGSEFDSSEEVHNVTSENYPMPYPVSRTVKQELAVNSSGINIVITDLDIDPDSDYLSLVPLYNNGSEAHPVILTGRLNQPLNFRFLGIARANLIFSARTDDGHKYRGFAISYASYGDSLQPTTQPPDVTLGYDQLITISKLLVIAKDNQTDVTWKQLKQLFANATNTYLNTTNQTLEQAYPENITFTRVADCFHSWPDSRDCAEVEFAITLYNDTKKTPSDDPYLIDLTPREPAGLSKSQLEQMWKLYGRTIFEKEGITEYELPDTRTRILMWIGIAIGSCVLLFLIFVAVFRSPAFRDRWVEDDTVAIKNNEETSRSGNYDVTIYPSPDQVIPEMYPGSQNGTTNGHAPPPPEGRIRTNTFETYTEDEGPSTRM